MAKLKEKVLELADIAKSLPDNLQNICFELLLKHHLDPLAGQQASSTPKNQTDEKFPIDADNNKGEADKPPSQEDIANSDLHIKARRFMEKQSVSLEQLNNLFYKQGQQIKPLYEDLKTTRMSEGQIRIALLQALHSAIRTGDFDADVEAVRKQCTDRKCYDSPNFAAHFRNNKTLFAFDKYTKTTKTVRLSEAGRKELAQVIKELQ